MIRNAMESDFREFKQLKKSSVLIWKCDKCGQKWFSGSKNARQPQNFLKKLKVYWYKNARNVIKRDFLVG